jgi:hypothetical protein
MAIDIKLVLALFMLGLWSPITYAQSCILLVPPNPLTAAGLATPYQVSGNGCTQQVNPSFVEATILQNGALFVYNPLVINAGDTPAVAPVVPNISATAVVGLWFGTNGNTLTLTGGAALVQGKCVNGLPGSIFGQFAYCNAPAFFAAVKRAAVKIPPLGTGLNGVPCYTTRSFQVVDMDPNDNVVATYLLLPNGKVAQSTAANKAKFPNATEINNGSDELLLDKFLRPALGCTAFTAPDLADPGATKGSLALNEIQAGAMQAAPIAFVPPQDPMVLVNGAPNAAKLKLYQAGVNQVAVNASAANLANLEVNFCTQFKLVGATSIKNDMKFTKGKPSPAPAMAVDLFAFLCSRYAISFGANGLNCVGTLNVTNPVTPVNNAQGITTDCTFNF